MTIRKTLKQMRIDKRLTQEDVAEKLKVSQSYYSAIERGKKKGELEEAMKTINGMRSRGSRTEGGPHKAGRLKQKSV